MKHEVLLVDAERRSVRVVEVALRSAGYTVRIAGNGVDALEKAQAAAPEILVTESRLPKLDGYSLVRALRERPETARISTIVLTDASEDWGQWHALGDVERISKPVFVRELVACVGLLVARRARARMVSGTAESASHALAGSTEDLAVVDLLQSFEMLGESGVLHLLRRAQQAEIHFREGRAVDATAGRLRGERAIYAVLGWNDAAYEVEFKSVDREDVIDRSTGTLLMEGMRRLDEMANTYAQGRLTPIPEVDPFRLLDQSGVRANDKPAAANHEEGRFAGDPPPSAAPPLPQAAPAPSGGSPVREADYGNPEIGVVKASAQVQAAQWSIADVAGGPVPASRVVGSQPASPAAASPSDPSQARTASPSSRPWTREIDLSSDLFFDDDVPVPGQPRKVSQTAKRVVAASVTVASLICVLAALRAVSAQRDRLADSARRPTPSPLIVASSKLAAGQAPGVDPVDLPRATETGAGASAGAQTEEKTSPAALQETADVGSLAEEVDASPKSATGQNERVEGVQTAAPVEGRGTAVPEGRPAPPQTPPNGAVAGSGASPASGAVAVRGASAAAGDMTTSAAPKAPSPVALIHQAEEALVQGDNQRAVLLATEAVATSPSDAAGWLVLASAHRAMGEDEAARMDYRRCVAQAQTAGVNDCRILGAR
ncbi:MAG TPA: DUF4388 domain-containing protein [Polyangiaceae bacterium]|nr:DUF4388 domain-containing protein [Polyangiaceae bacterium]